MIIVACLVPKRYIGRVIDGKGDEDENDEKDDEDDLEREEPDKSQF